jgi:hypothetical protein
VASLDLLIGMMMLFGPWLLGGFFGRRWGRSWIGETGTVALGVMLTVAGLAAFLLTAAPSAEEACGEDECLRYFGRWIESSLGREWPLYTVVAWTASVAFSPGVGGRASGRGRSRVRGRRRCRSLRLRAGGGGLR